MYVTVQIYSKMDKLYLYVYTADKELHRYS